MADFAPPSGPPPPRVPEGWKAVWNAQYSEWFFVNLYTKQSQWEKPTEPVYPAGEGPPHGPPPGYAPPASGAVGGYPTGTSEKSSFGSNNPYANMNEDEKLARRLQDEEEARAGRRSGDTRPATNDYYNQPGQPQPGQYGGYGQQSASGYPQGQTPYQDTATHDKSKSKGGLLGKLIGKATGGSSSSHANSSHAYPPQQHGYGGAPAGYYGGGYQQRPTGMPMGMGGGMGGRRPGGGMGAGGAMALGAGGGLLGGALLGSAMGDAGDGGFGDGGDYGGGDYGGGDGGFGGDGGGDFGGGDGGGGDFGGGD